MKFAAYMAVSFITFLCIPLVLFLYHCIYGCMILFNFVSYVFYCYIYILLLLLFMFCSVYSVSLCCFVYYLCVNVYCTAATG